MKYFGETKYWNSLRTDTIECEEYEECLKEGNCDEIKHD